ncbi:YdcH family protein [Moraxella nasibovis]|uniref:YdcH family protein n=1 Tax=Moraxella nasibovis TaxID=2904120 RepID=UPI002410688B|nr:YdcH family protein [Moraxella nasibovis]WFF38369.1 YdcH family protein [Moraxella nasibovis]
MFPEYRELITKLKTENDLHFVKLFDAHNDLDEEINNLENDPVAHTSRSEEIEGLKRKKLALKDELYQYLQTKA